MYPTQRRCGRGQPRGKMMVDVIVTDTRFMMIFNIAHPVINTCCSSIKSLLLNLISIILSCIYKFIGENAKNEGRYSFYIVLL